jgi:hypothetical protein
MYLRLNHMADMAVVALAAAVEEAHPTGVADSEKDEAAVAEEDEAVVVVAEEELVAEDNKVMV